MASVSPGGGSSKNGRRRAMDAEINLVPFIDLLSMCICFLLMTAVWMEIGAIQIKQVVGTKSSSPATAPYEMEVAFLNSNDFVVKIKKGGRATQRLKVSGETMPERLEKLSAALKGFSQKLGFNGVATKEQMNKLVSAVRIRPKAGIPYGDIIQVMDGFRNSGFFNLGIIPVRK